MLGRANSTAHKKLRRCDRSGCYNNFSSLIKSRVKCLHSVISHQIICDSCRSLGFIEVDSADHGTSSNDTILSLHCLTQESICSGATFSVSFRHLESTNTILRSRPVVKVVVCSKASLRANFEESFAQRILVSNIAHLPISFRSMEFRGSTGVILLASLEEGQNIGCLPACYAPIVVVLGGSTVVKANIRAGRSTEDLTTLQENVSPVAVLFTTSLVLPIVFCVSEETKDSSRDTDNHGIVIWGTSLQYQNLFPVCGESVSKKAPGQPTTCNDIIIALAHGLGFYSMSAVKIGNRRCSCSGRCRHSCSGIQQRHYLQDLQFHVYELR
mmetsp:Transcript_9843/g.20455  ORF Transcript_9843/g.20455 Transcript_9843/m.20455 type:complete len:327 (+) Transcript_9843:1094-2074(+)